MMVVLLCLAGCKERHETKGDIPEEKPEVIELMIGDTQVKLEVVADDSSRSRGLMFRDSLAENTGMLFIFPYERIYSFWMKNTLIPLSIAFINSSGEIVGTDEMRALDTLTFHKPSRPYQFAIEMDSGWFSAHGVKPGDRLALPAMPWLSSTPE